MKVYGICGSPRRGGNTEILLDRFLEGASSKGGSVEKIILNEMVFSPCQECDNMRDDGECIVEDEMRAVYSKVEEADIIVVATPLFFGSVSAQTKMMVDRFQCYWRARFLLKTKRKNIGKKGVFIGVAGGRKEFLFDNARKVVRNFFATVGAEPAGEILAEGVEDKGDVGYCEDILGEAFVSGQNIVNKEGKNAESKKV